jgi:hypothetical protein
MPWNPPSQDVPPHDERLDPFMDRAGILTAGDVEVGTVVVAAETWWTRVGGHLWWSRWSAPQEVLRGSVRWADGQVADRLSAGEQLEDDLREWPAGRFTHAGTAYRVVWLDEEESARVRG